MIVLQWGAACETSQWVQKWFLVLSSHKPEVAYVKLCRDNKTTATPVRNPVTGAGLQFTGRALLSWQDALQHLGRPCWRPSWEFSSHNSRQQEEETLGLNIWDLRAHFLWHTPPKKLHLLQQGHTSQECHSPWACRSPFHSNHQGRQVDRQINDIYHIYRIYGEGLTNTYRWCNRRNVIPFQHLLFATSLLFLDTLTQCHRQPLALVCDLTSPPFIQRSH